MTGKRLPSRNASIFLRYASSIGQTLSEPNANNAMTHHRADTGRKRTAAEQPASATVFDRWSTTYDKDFTDCPPGAWLRDSVRRKIEPLLVAGSSVLEFGCGTGEDAAWFAGRGHPVLATDVAPQMLNVARRKASTRGLAIEFQEFDLNRHEAADLPAGRQFDVIFANFGVFNCVADPARLFSLCGKLVPPGGLVCTVVMGRFCAWETLWFVLRRRWRDAVRRWRGTAVVQDGDAEFNVYYYSPRDLRSAAAEAFVPAGLTPIGIALPPSYLFRYEGRWPKTFRVLSTLERMAQKIGLFAYAADHYLLVLRRRKP